IDFVTLEGAKTDPYEAARTLPDGVIYSFNVVGDPHDLIFSSGSGAEYGIGGFALVRRDDELSVLVLAGKAADLEGETDRLQDTELGHPVPGKEWLTRDRDLSWEATSLHGTSDLWKTLALARLDLQRRTIEVRYLLRDIRDAYVVASDDPS